MILTVRPLDQYPGVETDRWARRHGPFGRVTWDSTLNKLDHELEAIDAYNVVLLMDVTEGDLRLNGSIRAGAQPRTPRVVVAFESKHGALKYACDRFHDWHDNVRGIAHGLEALRKLDRYGIASRGEQYTGWKALGAGIAMGPASMSSREAAEFISREHQESGGPEWADDILADPDLRDALYRAAAKRLHPDAGGDESMFKRLGDAKRVLDEAV